MQAPSLMKIPLPGAHREPRRARGPLAMRQGCRARLQISVLYPFSLEKTEDKGGSGLHQNHSARSNFTVSNKRRGRARSQSLGEIPASREIPFLTPTLLWSCRSKKKSPQLDPPAHSVRNSAWRIRQPRRTRPASCRHSNNKVVARSRCRLGVPGRRRFSCQRSSTANEGLLIQGDGSSGQRSRAACRLLR